MPDISEKWIPVARVWTGNDKGRHCHWCKHIVHKDGNPYCGHIESEAYDERMRSWDGSFAEECKFFELDEWYTKDENYYETFKES